VLKDIKDYYGTLELADPTLTATPEDNSQAGLLIVQTVWTKILRHPMHIGAAMGRMG
jgi:hypothetical protein